MAAIVKSQGLDGCDEIIYLESICEKLRADKVQMSVVWNSW